MMASHYKVVSHHLLRRTARKRARLLNVGIKVRDHVFVVEKAKRGPWRWRVALKPLA